MAQQALAPSGDVYAAGGDIPIQAGLAGPQVLQTLPLHGELLLRAVAEGQLASGPVGAEFPALFGRVARELDLLLQGGDRPDEVGPLAQLIASGGGIGVVGRLGDRPRPARGGLRGDHPLALRPDLLVVAKAGGAAPGQVRTREPPQMGSQSFDHSPVGVRDA